MHYEKFDINTTQNVKVSYEPAGIFDRALAWLLDLLVQTVYGLIIWIIALSIISHSNHEGDSMSVWGYILFAVLGLPLFLYHFLCEVFFNGQSLGKKVMNIKVVKIDGLQPSIGAYLLRWMLRLVDFTGVFPLIGLVSVMATQKMQRLGDLAANTTVIKLNPRATLHNTILHRAIPGYKVTFKEVHRLSDRDIGIIKEVYEHCRKAKDYDALVKLANKVREQMGLGVVNMTAEQFINTVLADYTQFEFEE